jgi:glycine/D-amino acid oxidase-like deaminating enzyme
MPDVVVIGGGIIGASVTYRLVKAGARVTLLEANHLASGASSASFAWINADDKPPLAYHRLNVHGMAEHLRLCSELGGAPWLHRSGRTAWANGVDGPARLRARVAQQQAWGYPVDILPISELRAREPELVAPRGVEEFAWYPTEGYVDVPLLIGELTSLAGAAGAMIREGCRVTGFVLVGSRCQGVRLANGDIVRADRVVVCAGASAGDVAALAGLRLPMASNVGMTAVTAPSVVDLRSIHTDDVMTIRPDGAGRVLLRHDTYDALVERTTPVEPVPAVCTELLKRVVEVVPRLSGTRLETCRITTRPLTADLLPIVGPAPHFEGLYLVSTHSGVTLGPLLGRLVSREVLEGRMEPRLEPYRPERLVTPLPAPRG